jgi:hypothetical protein
LRAEQPVAKAANGQVADAGKSVGIVAVNDQPGDFIGFIRNQCFVEKVREGQVRQGHLRGHAFSCIAGSHAGEEVA